VPTVKFNIQEEVMKEALKIKNQLGLTWKEITLRGLGMPIIPQSRMGRPPKPKTREKTDDQKKLENQIMDIFNKTFYNSVIWRNFLPVENLSDAGWKFYKYYRTGKSLEENTDSHGSVNLPYNEIKLPVIQDTLHAYRNGQLNTQGIQKSATRLAGEEGKLVLTGEHEGWQALGIEGMLTVDGRNTVVSSEKWPEGAIRDLVLVRKTFKPKDPIVLIVSSSGYKLLSQVMWEDPTHVRPPTTYKRFLLEREIISKIYEVDELYTQRGTQDSAIVYTPSNDNAWLVQGMKPTPYLWDSYDNEVMCTVREVINIAISRPATITEITDIGNITTPQKTPSVSMEGNSYSN